MKQVGERGTGQRFAFRVLMKVAEMGRALGLNLGKMFFAKVHRLLGTHIRYLITGGSRFEPNIGHDLETLGFDILQAYGLTECTGGATITGLGERFTGSVGRPLPGMQVQIFDSGLASEVREDGARSGEVAIQGGIVMKGYFNRPD